MRGQERTKSWLVHSPRVLCPNDRRRKANALTHCDATRVGSARDGLRRLAILGPAERTLLSECEPSDHKAGHACAVAVDAWVDACRPGTSYNLPPGLQFKRTWNEVPARCRRRAVRNHAGNTLCSLRLSSRINVCLRQFFSSSRWHKRPPLSCVLGAAYSRLGDHLQSWVPRNGGFYDSPRRVHRL